MHTKTRCFSRLRYRFNKNCLIFIFAMAFFLFVFCPDLFAQVIYVKTDGSDTGAGTSWETALSNIQAAINSAQPNDEIWVKAGLYTLSSQINVDEAVAIYGGFAGTETAKSQRDWEANVTTVDGQGTVRGFFVTADATIDGLIVTNCSNYQGAGLYIEYSSPTIRNCTFSGNNAGDEGGGICIYYGYPSSNVIISNCTFSGNNAEYDGGGIYMYDAVATITNSTFSVNTADNGGGIYISDSRLTITNCTFNGNIAESEGGGINNVQSDSNINNCNFLQNSAENGGGIRGDGDTITNSIFYGNIAEQAGGGVYNSHLSDPTITNNIFYGNNAQVRGGDFTTAIILLL